MAFFNSGVTSTYLGYKRVFVPVAYGELPVEDLPYFPLADPRGKLPPGIVPSSSLSYRTFIQFFEFTTDTSAASNVLRGFLALGTLGAGLGGLFGLASVLGDVTFSTSYTMIGMILFEGRDVIDLPTDGLRREGNVIYVPDRVARPLYASEQPWIQNNQSIAREAAFVYGGVPDERNLLVGVQISDTPTSDIKTVYSQGGPSRTHGDTASNGIVVNGNPSYVSYVAIDKQLFRDVIITKVSTQLEGLATALSGFNAINTSFGNAETYVLRYSWVNVAAEGEEEKFAWRLSQSLGIDPAGGASNVERLPDDILSSLSADERSLAATYSVGKQYAYDLKGPGDDTSGDNLDIVPAKRAFHPFLARAMGNDESQYFDQNKLFQFVGAKPGFGSNGLTDTYAVGVIGSTSFGGAAPTPVPEFGFTSPRWELNFTQQTRMLMEYAVRRPYMRSAIVGISPRNFPALLGTLAGTSDLQILAGTIEAKGGIAAVNDCCLNTTRVFDVEAGGAGAMIVERQFDDTIWQTSVSATPMSQSQSFMVGEFPFRSIGRPILLPTQESLAVSGDGTIELGDSNQYVTALLMRVTDDSPLESFRALASQEGSGDPLFEASLGSEVSVPSSSASPQMLLGVPGIRFEAFRDGGRLSLIEAFGATKGIELLGAYGASGTLDVNQNPQTKNEKREVTEAKLLNLSNKQLSRVEAQLWPIEANNVAACSDCSSGDVFLAFENGNRIDMAKGSCTELFSVVRDVTLRVPDEEDSSKEANRQTTTGDNLPSATMPFVVQDGTATKTVFLFFAYKDKILSKRIPMEVFSRPRNDDGFYPVATERAIAQDLHRLGADLVYDGAGDLDDEAKARANNEQAPASSIFLDIDVGSVRVRQDGDEIPAERPEQAVQYSAILDVSGYMYAFIQAGKRIVVRKSTDLGERWTDAMPRTFSFIPAADPDEESDGESPSVLYDDGIHDIILFMSFRQSLVYVRFPAEILRKPPEEVAAALAPYMKPKLLFGILTTEMFNRGILPANIINPIGTTNISTNRLSNQRVAAVKTTAGYYRVFFKDEDLRLRSMVSFDAGETWRHADEIRGTEEATNGS